MADKPCPLCGETIKEEAVKCRFCGEFLEQAAGGRLAGAEHARQAPQGHEVATDTEIIFEGNASRIALVGPVLTMIVWLCIAVLVVVFGNSVLQVTNLPAEKLGYVPGTIAAGIAIITLAYSWSKWIIHKSRVYRITNDRIEYEQGIFSKSIQNIDMWRVQDVGFSQSFLQKLLGIGVVRVLSSDKSDPQIDIGPVNAGRALYDSLKKAQMHADRRRGVVHVEG